MDATISARQLRQEELPSNC